MIMMDDEGWGRARPSRTPHVRRPNNDRESTARSSSSPPESVVRPRCIDDDASPPAAAQGGAETAAPPSSPSSSSPTMHRRRSDNPLRDRVLPGYDGAPCGELNQKLLGCGDANRYYTLWDNTTGKSSPPSQTKFTCVFTCPWTGEHFACGHWKTEGVMVDESTTYWYNKKSAKNAAAAKYLDCMSLRMCHGTERTPYIRCVDPPYLKGEGPPLPTLPPDVKLPIVDVDAAIMAGNSIAPSTNTKRALVEWYISFWKDMDEVGLTILPDVERRIPNNPECYSCWSNMMMDGKGRRFTGLFVCPLTGEKFLSGKLVHDDNNDWTEDHMFYHNDRELLLSKLRFGGDGDAEEEDGCADDDIFPRVDLVWYATKSKAMEAAAGRALDCLGHRASVHAGDDVCTMIDERCCAEEPFLRNESPSCWNGIDCDSVAAAEDMVYESATRLKPVYVVFGALPEDERITARFDVEDFHSLVGKSNSDDVWRERYRDQRKNGDSMTVIEEW